MKGILLRSTGYAAYDLSPRANCRHPSSTSVDERAGMKRPVLSSLTACVFEARVGIDTAESPVSCGLNRRALASPRRLGVRVDGKLMK